MRIAALLFAAAVFSSALVAAQTTPVVPLSIPTAIYTDPPADKAHPAAMDVLHIPTHGLLINGLIYQPAGAGPHPTLVICHGLPGNEKNLDLAQAVRRAGWNAVTFNYRGSWGSPGSFRFAQNIEDANAVLVYLRDPANATRLGVDPKRIAIAADMGALAENQPKAGVVAEMNGDMESLAGATAESMADEVIAHAKEYRFSGNVDGLGQIPLLVLSADDGLAPETDALVKGLTGNGSRKVTAIHVATDHSWSDHRIFLESTIITWLAALNQGQPR
jgi:hypothetical protein